MDALQSTVLSVMDILLGWLTYIPGTAAIIIIGLGTALILVLVRKPTTNQDLLERCSQDKKTLKKRIKKTKKHDLGEVVNDAVHAGRHAIRNHGSDLSDKGRQRLIKLINKDLKSQAVNRLSIARRRVIMKTIKQEGLPLLAAIGLIIFIATWCYARLGFHPPEPGEPVRVVAYFPVTQINRVAHLVPQQGLESENGWIQAIEAERMRDTVVSGSASWIVRGEAGAEPHPIIVRFSGGEYTHELLVGQRHYSEALAPQEDSPEHGIELQMRPLKLFGIVPGFGWFLPPWIVGYLLITIPAVPLLKKLLGIY